MHVSGIVISEEFRTGRVRRTTPATRGTSEHALPGFGILKSYWETRATVVDCQYAAWRRPEEGYTRTVLFSSTDCAKSEKKIIPALDFAEMRIDLQRLIGWMVDVKELRGHHAHY